MKKKDNTHDIELPETPEEIYELGCDYFYGRGVEQDQARGITLFIEAAEQDDLDAQFELAKAYHYGRGVECDGEEADKWYRRLYDEVFGGIFGHIYGNTYDDGEMLYEWGNLNFNILNEYDIAYHCYDEAAEQHHDGAQYCLAYFYENGIEVEKDMYRAIELYFHSAAAGNEKALQKLKDIAGQGNIEAHKMLGKIYSIYENNRDEAIRWYTKPAEQGDADAQSNLGDLYMSGKTEADKAEAVEWYRKAAGQDNQDAEFKLAGAYRDGIGVTANRHEALQWFIKAALQGNLNAQLYLGEAYRDGGFVEKDITEATKWFRMAAEKGSTYAQYQLALIYDTCEYSGHNHEEAVKWFESAAMHGTQDMMFDVALILFDSDDYRDNARAFNIFTKLADKAVFKAKYYLGLAYENGKGVAQDYKKAAKLYKNAARHGDAYSQYRFALALENGTGVRPNAAEAKSWFEKAAAQGIHEAKDRLQKQ